MRTLMCALKKDCDHNCIIILTKRIQYDDAIMVTILFGTDCHMLKSHPQLFLPARASEQGCVIGLVSVYIYIYCVRT